MERNRAYYRKFPEDIAKVKEIIEYLTVEDLKLPSGGNFSVLRFRQLGYYFGFHGLFPNPVILCHTEYNRLHGLRAR